MVSELSAFATVDGIENEIVTEEEPRLNSGALIVLRMQDGRRALLDGRRRANKWMKQPGSYPVLVIDWSSRCS